MGDYRDVASPLTTDMLASMPEDCAGIAFEDRLTDSEYHQLAALLERQPDKNLYAIQLEPRHGGPGPDAPITDLGFLRFFPNLQRFSCKLEYLQRLDGVEHLKNAREIHIRKTLRNMSAVPLAALTNLGELWLDGHFSDREALRNLTGLIYFKMGYAGEVADLNFLPPSITRFSMNLGSITDISALTALPNLHRLSFHKVHSLTDLSPLAALTGLRHLYLAKLYKVSNLFDMSTMAGLTELELYDLNHLTDLRPVLTAPNLTTLSVYNLPALQPGSWHDTCTGWLAQGKPPFWEN